MEELTDEQQELKRLFETHRQYGRELFLRCEANGHALAPNDGGEAICLICDTWKGRFCPDSPNHTCEWQAQKCRHCGRP